jgi:YfiR/HmsC-like
VGEANGFLGQGGVIEFQLIDDTLRFSINIAAADRCGLKIRSELLSVAYSISGKQK